MPDPSNILEFTYIGGQLHCEGVALDTIAKDVDTPCYVYSARALTQAFRRYEQALAGTDALICYALKANGNPEVLRLLAGLGAGADVVSEGELRLALEAGFPPDCIVFAGVGKRDHEIRMALEAGILAFNVESLQELEVINGLAVAAGKPAGISIRVNPDIDVDTHPYITTGRAIDKFGVPLAEAGAAFGMARDLPGLRIEGIHCHIGSQILDAAPHARAAHKLAGFVRELAEEGIHLDYVDIGGGFGVQYRNLLSGEAPSPQDLPPSAEDLIAAVLPELKGLDCRFIIEPGRSLVANAGALLTRVLYTKETSGKRFAIVDAGMNDLIRPSLYQAYHEIVTATEREDDGQEVDVVGPICESGDFLAQDRRLPSLDRGDLLAVLSAGAYGFALSSNYNARPRAAEVMVEGEVFRVVRARD